MSAAYLPGDGKIREVVYKVGGTSALLLSLVGLAWHAYRRYRENVITIEIAECVQLPPVPVTVALIPRSSVALLLGTTPAIAAGTPLSSQRAGKLRNRGVDQSLRRHRHRGTSSNLAVPTASARSRRRGGAVVHSRSNSLQTGDTERENSSEPVPAWGSPRHVLPLSKSRTPEDRQGPAYKSMNLVPCSIVRDPSGTGMTISPGLLPSTELMCGCVRVEGYVAVTTELMRTYRFALKVVAANIRIAKNNNNLLPANSPNSTVNNNNSSPISLSVHSPSASFFSDPSSFFGFGKSRRVVNAADCFSEDLPVLFARRSIDDPRAGRSGSAEVTPAMIGMGATPGVVVPTAISSAGNALWMDPQQQPPMSSRSGFTMTPEMFSTVSPFAIDTGAYEGGTGAGGPDNLFLHRTASDDTRSCSLFSTLGSRRGGATRGPFILLDQIHSMVDRSEVERRHQFHFTPACEANVELLRYRSTARYQDPSVCAKGHVSGRPGPAPYYYHYNGQEAEGSAIRESSGGPGTLGNTVNSAKEAGEKKNDTSQRWLDTPPPVGTAPFHRSLIPSCLRIYPSSPHSRHPRAKCMDFYIHVMNEIKDVKLFIRLPNRHNKVVRWDAEGVGRLRTIPGRSSHILWEVDTLDDRTVERVHKHREALAMKEAQRRQRQQEAAARRRKLLGAASGASGGGHPIRRVIPSPSLRRDMILRSGENLPPPSGRGRTARRRGVAANRVVVGEASRGAVPPLTSEPRPSTSPSPSPPTGGLALFRSSGSATRPSSRSRSSSSSSSSSTASSDSPHPSSSSSSSSAHTQPPPLEEEKRGEELLVLHFTLLYETVLSYDYTACMSDSDCSSTAEGDSADDQFSSRGQPHSPQLGTAEGSALESQVVEVEMLDEDDQVVQRISVGPGQEPSRNDPAAHENGNAKSSEGTFRSFLSRTPGLFRPFSSTKRTATTEPPSGDSKDTNGNKDKEHDKHNTNPIDGQLAPASGVLTTVPQLDSAGVTEFIPAAALDQRLSTREASLVSSPQLHFSHISPVESEAGLHSHSQSSPTPPLGTNTTMTTTTTMTGAVDVVEAGASRLLTSLHSNTGLGALLPLTGASGKKAPSLRFTYRTAGVASGLSIKQLKVLSERDNWEPSNTFEFYLGRILFRGFSHQPLVKLENKTTWVIQPVTVTECS